jgi:hypothetical protein
MSLKVKLSTTLICLTFLTLSAAKIMGQTTQDAKGLYQPKNDTLFSKPYIDIDEWRDKPVRHRYVHGGFKGTLTKFSFYFPSKE